MSEVAICVHCKNPVEEIPDKEGSATVMRTDTLQNVFRHGRPRPYPVCSVNPLMQEDVEYIEDGED